MEYINSIQFISTEEDPPDVGVYVLGVYFTPFAKSIIYHVVKRTEEKRKLTGDVYRTMATHEFRPPTLWTGLPTLEDMVGIKGDLDQ